MRARPTQQQRLDDYDCIFLDKAPLIPSLQTIHEERLLFMRRSPKQRQRVEDDCIFFDTAAMATTPNLGAKVQIREVWADNLEHEFQLIREIVDDFPYLALDTRAVVKAGGHFNHVADYHYQTLRANMDFLKLIQLGLTFSDKNGNLPRCGTMDFCIWQFNFKEINLKEDLHASGMTQQFRHNGIDVQAHEESGIDPQSFGELVMSSGMVLNENVHWVTFHSGYNFGYLLKLLTCQNLPSSEAQFFNLLRTFFPTVHDTKYLIKVCNNFHGDLNRLAQILGFQRIGRSHQAGSDSLLTALTFYKLKERFLNGSLEMYVGVLYGLEEGKGQLSTQLPLSTEITCDKNIHDFKRHNIRRRRGGSRKKGREKDRGSIVTLSRSSILVIEP